MLDLYNFLTLEHVLEESQEVQIHNMLTSAAVHMLLIEKYKLLSILARLPMSFPFTSRVILIFMVFLKYVICFLFFLINFLYIQTNLQPYRGKGKL